MDTVEGSEGLVSTATLTLILMARKKDMLDMHRQIGAKAVLDTERKGNVLTSRAVQRNPAYRFTRPIFLDSSLKRCCYGTSLAQR